MSFEVRPLTSELWPALEELFGRSGASNGCWCMYWLLGPEYHRRDRALNKRALREDAAHAPGPGLLALDGDRPVGWCRVSPRSELPWLEQNRQLARVDDVAVWSVPCFFVRKADRGRGVAGALVGGAIEHARAHGAPALEAYPIDTSVPGATRNTFPGIAIVFERAGFREVARRSPTRPVLRHDLRR